MVFQMMLNIILYKLFGRRYVMDLCDMRILIVIPFGLVLLIEPIGESVIQLLAQAYPGLLILIGTGTLIWVVAVRWERFHTRFKTTEAQCDSIKKTDLPETNNRLDETISTLDKVMTFLIATHGIGVNIFKAKSPISLTEIGMQILKLSGGKMYVDERLTELLQEINALHPPTGLDVDKIAYQVLFKRRDTGTLDDVKNFVFQNPELRFNEIKITIEIGLITQIMAVYLRERYLERYPTVLGRSGNDHHA